MGRSADGRLHRARHAGAGRLHAVRDGPRMAAAGAPRHRHGAGAQPASRQQMEGRPHPGRRQGPEREPRDGRGLGAARRQPAQRLPSGRRVRRGHAPSRGRRAAHRRGGVGHTHDRKRRLPRRKRPRRRLEDGETAEIGLPEGGEPSEPAARLQGPAGHAGHPGRGRPRRVRRASRRPYGRPVRRRHGGHRDADALPLGRHAPRCGRRLLRHDAVLPVPMVSIGPRLPAGVARERRQGPPCRRTRHRPDRPASARRGRTPDRRSARRHASGRMRTGRGQGG